MARNTQVMYNAAMDEDDEILFDVSEQFAFGDQENDTDLIFSEYHTSQRSQSATWQRIVEMKSAAHEGYMAYYILAEREEEGLPVYAKSLFSVHSPLEKFSQDNNFFSGMITSRQHYVEHRQDGMEKLTELTMLSPIDSQLAMKLAEVKELLSMQLYGYGRAALQDGEVTLSLEAFRVANIIRKEKVIAYILEYVTQNPTAREQVQEYMHFHG